jgi:predicted acylesterase/phospholipase RssA
VLDRLLLEPNLKIIGISGTSAGAMKAAILAERRNPSKSIRTSSARSGL